MLSVIINGWAISIATVARLRPRPRPWECVGEHVHLSRAISSDTRVIWRDLRTSRCLVLCIWFRRTLRISSLQELISWVICLYGFDCPDGFVCGVSVAIHFPYETILFVILKLLFLGGVIYLWLKSPPKHHIL